MKTRFLALSLAFAFIATPLTMAYAMECKVVAVDKKTITMECDEAEVQGESLKVKNKVKIEKIK